MKRPVILAAALALLAAGAYGQVSGPPVTLQGGTAPSAVGQGGGNTWFGNPTGSTAFGKYTTLPKTIVFTVTGTYTPTTGVHKVHVLGCGAGGGGGGGAQQVSGTAVSGGGGGGGGGCFNQIFRVSDLGASVTITVGVAGTAGTAAGASNTAGGNGGAGGTTSFGTLAFGCGGGGGAGGQLNAGSGGGGGGGYNGFGSCVGGNATSATGGAAPINATCASSAGGTASFPATNTQYGCGGGGAGSTATGVSNTLNFANGPSGGPSGGGVTAAPASNNGSAGACSVFSAFLVGGAGGTAGTPNGGAPGALTLPYAFGCAGGSGYGNSAGNGGNGAAGIQGGGGAGGGSVLNGSTPGTGGAGGGGFIVVFEELGTSSIDVSRRIGIAQAFISNWTLANYTANLGARDYIWNNEPGSAQGANLILPQSTFSGAYVTVGRVPALARMYGSVLVITACGNPSGGCPLSWFQTNHPSWIMLKHDQATPAYEFGDTTWIPLDYTNAAVRSWIETNFITPVLGAGYQGISVDNVGDQNTWDREGVCSVAVVTGTCVSNGGVFTQKWSGAVNNDAQYLSDQAAWLKALVAFVHTTNQMVSENINYDAANQAGTATLIATADIWYDEDGFTGDSQFPSACDPAGGGSGSVGQTWIDKENFILTVAPPNGIVQENSICSIGATSLEAVLEYAIASNALTKGTYSYVAPFSTTRLVM